MEKIILTEADADEFLESIGITLYEDSMIIGETEVSGVVGQAALQEYGIFLYEDSILIEGQQAEVYKARKAKEAEEALEAEEDRFDRRYSYSGEKEIRRKDNFYYPHDKSVYSKPNINPNRNKVFDTNISPKNKLDHLNKQSKIDKQANRSVNKEYTRRAYETIAPRSSDGTNFDPKEHRNYDDVTYDMSDKEVVNFQNGLIRAADAKARHIRRHPNQYKESYGVFEDIKFV